MFFHNIPLSKLTYRSLQDILTDLINQFITNYKKSKISVVTLYSITEGKGKPL